METASSLPARVRNFSGVTILLITRDATRRIWYRLMDAVDPSLVNQIERFASEVAGVERVTRLRVRWVGHELFAS